MSAHRPECPANLFPRACTCPDAPPPNWSVPPVVVKIDPADIEAAYAHPCDHPESCPTCQMLRLRFVR